MTKVYLISNGEYSDYYIADVQTNKKKAEEIVEKLNSIDTLEEWRYEEIETNQLDFIIGRQPYEFLFDEYGFLIEESENVTCTWCKPNIFNVYYRGKDGFFVVVWAKDKKIAEEIASKIVGLYIKFNFNIKDSRKKIFLDRVSKILHEYGYSDIKLK